MPPIGRSSNRFHFPSGIQRCTARRAGRQISTATAKYTNGRMNMAIAKLIPPF